LEVYIPLAKSFAWVKSIEKLGPNLVKILAIIKTLLVNA
jgi:hypothetical protein